ncbi:hypothetical protein BN1232_06284 [Mycobacterium lentiflavum]|uniref:Uncharacterized protein n=1 Tax=Mycobacterium lentiflavum TaxID=141349 RepID=A0A0E3WED5_MYCLN|nr:hypothetical protein BN1232_06284 [Mycobacterium lentiflavum]
MLLYRVFRLRQFNVGSHDNVLLGGLRVTVNTRHSIEVIRCSAVDPRHAPIIGSQLAIYFVARFPTRRLCSLFPHRVSNFEPPLQLTDSLRQRHVVGGVNL